MNEKLNKLTTDEMTSLDQLFRKSKKEVVSNSVILAVVLFIISVVPIGIAKLFSSTPVDIRENPSQSLIQSWGLGAWFIVFLLTNLVCVIML